MLIIFITCFSIYFLNDIYSFKNVQFILYGMSSLIDMQPFVFKATFFRFLFIIVGLLISICIINLVSNNRINFISEEGKNTLVYYVFHGILVKVIFFYVFLYNIKYSFTFIILIFISIVWICYLLTKNKLVKKLIL